MKDRTRQRENRKLKKKSRRKPWLNHEGYYDMTAYQAIKNITKSESRRKKQNIEKLALLTT